MYCACAHVCVCFWIFAPVCFAVKSFTEAEQVLGAAWQLAEALHPATVKNDVLRRLSDSQLSLDIQQYLTIQRNDQQRYFLSVFARVTLCCSPSGFHQGVCVCVCVCARASACVCARVRVCMCVNHYIIKHDMLCTLRY